MERTRGLVNMRGGTLPDESRRNMAQWLATLDKLAELYPEVQQADDDVEAVWNGLQD